MREIYRVFYLVCAFAPSSVWADFLLGGVVPFPTAPVGPVVAFPTVTNGAGMMGPVAFPGTVADLSMADKVALRTAGYEPYKDLKSYADLIVEGEEHFTARMAALAESERLEDYADMTNEEYCEHYPLDDEHCPQNPGALEAIIGIGSDDGTAGQQYSGPTIGGGIVVANNQVRGGSCYPAARDDNFRNEILTTGRYETVSPAFEKAMITLFRKEGKCGIIKGDPCGYTCYGIGENCLGKQLGLTRADISKLTRAGAEDIYYKHYWQKYNIGILPDVIAPDVLWAMVGSGSITGIRQFRKFLGVNTEPKDKLDENVARAVMDYNGDIHNRWLDKRQEFLIQIAANPQYNNRVLEGWMRGIKLKRNNGCHVIPSDPLYRKSEIR